MNAIVAALQPSDFTGLAERSLLGRVLPVFAGDWMAWAIGINDCVLGLGLVAAMWSRRTRPVVLAWAGVWLLAVTIIVDDVATRSADDRFSAESPSCRCGATLGRQEPRSVLILGQAAGRGQWAGKLPIAGVASACGEATASRRDRHAAGYAADPRAGTIGGIRAAYSPGTWEFMTVLTRPLRLPLPGWSHTSSRC